MTCRERGREASRGEQRAVESSELGRAASGGGEQRVGESSEWGRAASGCEQRAGASNEPVRAASGCKQRAGASSVTLLARTGTSSSHGSRTPAEKTHQTPGRIASVRKESAPNDETSLSQALQGRVVARYRNRRFSIDRSDQLTGRSLVKVQVSSLERLPPQIAALAARSIIAVNSQQSKKRVVCPPRRQI